MYGMPEYRPDTEDACPVCRGIGRISEAQACEACAGSGTCPHRPLDQAWLRVVEATMSGDLGGAYAALERIRDGSFLRPGDEADEDPELDPAAVIDAVESLLRDNLFPDT